VAYAWIAVNRPSTTVHESQVVDWMMYQSPSWICHDLGRAGQHPEWTTLLIDLSNANEGRNKSHVVTWRLSDACKIRRLEILRSQFRAPSAK
jgi:hypothetical protein